MNFKGKSRLTDFTTASAHPAVQQKGLSATLVFTLFQQQRSNKETNLSFEAISSACTRHSYQEIYLETFRTCSKVFNSPLGLKICTQLQALIFFFKVFWCEGILHFLPPHISCSVIWVQMVHCLHHVAVDEPWTWKWLTSLTLPHRSSLKSVLSKTHGCSWQFQWQSPAKKKQHLYMYSVSTVSSNILEIWCKKKEIVFLNLFSFTIRCLFLFFFTFSKWRE